MKVLEEKNGELLQAVRDLEDQLAEMERLREEDRQSLDQFTAEREELIGRLLYYDHPSSCHLNRLTLDHSLIKGEIERLDALVVASTPQQQRLQEQERLEHIQRLEEKNAELEERLQVAAEELKEKEEYIKEIQDCINQENQETEDRLREVSSRLEESERTMIDREEKNRFLMEHADILEKQVKTL